jgi:hypothetical protein
MKGMRSMTAVVLLLVTCGCGCGSSPTRPDVPAASRIGFTAVSPPSGSTVIVPPGFPYHLPGGVVVPPDPGLISVGLSMTSAHDVPWAKLSVYVLTGEGKLDYCGQNLPDSPTWSFLPAGWTSAYTVKGFQVYRLPCDVTGIRAILHMRNNGLLIPPTPSETIAEATLAVSYHIER